MGVKELWRKALGDFRDKDLVLLESLSDKRVVVDTSAWVHKLDGIYEVAYARTSTPIYPHCTLKYSFAAKNRALTKLGMKPIFVFDGKSPNMKKRENARRHNNSMIAREQYQQCVDKIKNKLRDGDTVSGNDCRDMFQFRRKMALPTPEDYSSLCMWMEENGLEYVQAPFEADAQMKQIIEEGRATAAITEDGDLIVYEVPHIFSKTVLNIKDPSKST